jgi:hypothetical protein
MDRSLMAVLAEVIPNPAGAAVAAVAVGLGMAVPILEVGVPSHED